MRPGQGLGHLGTVEVYFMVYYCLYFKLGYMGAPKSFKCLGPLWVLIR